MPALALAGEDGTPFLTLPPSLGATAEERWNNLNVAATRALAQGQLAQAERLYVAALEEAQTLGAEDPRLAAALNNLGVLYVRAQQFERADELYRKALEVRQKALGPSHPQVGQSLSNLAYLRQAEGKLEESESFAKRAVALLEGALGAEDPALVSPLTQYAGLLRATKREREAEKVEERLKGLRAKAERGAAETPAAGADPTPAATAAAPAAPTPARKPPANGGR
ncbi:MAG: tetratricopeptide repeat protein [Gammaproteobacteria bacterium]|nr:tetratricopeptide repeat protein [Gammaproteobacteria bacterium]